jgi:ATP-dependent Clp protease ATP-binding subunit ClpX
VDADKDRSSATGTPQPETAKFEYTDGAIREIARKAKARGTGARSLRSIMESLMLEIMYDLPELEAGRTYTITEQVVRGEALLFGTPAA